jgi:GNAT superfamily N-acetyltransferase
MSLPKDYRIDYKNPTPIEYDSNRSTTNWVKLDFETMEKGLENSLFSVCLYDIDKLIGLGRIVGDGAIYFYIQDIIVVPEYQGKCLGKVIMNELMQYLDDNANHNSLVGLMAAEGVENFYHKFGFITRPASKPGMFFIHEKTK